MHRRPAPLSRYAWASGHELMLGHPPSGFSGRIHGSINHSESSGSRSSRAAPEHRTSSEMLSWFYTTCCCMQTFKKKVSFCLISAQNIFPAVSGIITMFFCVLCAFRSGCDVCFMNLNWGLQSCRCWRFPTVPRPVVNGAQCGSLESPCHSGPWWNSLFWSARSHMSWLTGEENLDVENIVWTFEPKCGASRRLNYIKPKISPWTPGFLGNPEQIRLVSCCFEFFFFASVRTSETCHLVCRGSKRCCDGRCNQRITSPSLNA